MNSGMGMNNNSINSQQMMTQNMGNQMNSNMMNPQQMMNQNLEIK